MVFVIFSAGSKRGNWKKKGEERGRISKRRPMRDISKVHER